MPDTDKNIEEKENSSDKEQTITELAEKHMNDETHTTTDEELLNAKIELSTPTPEEDDTAKLFEAENTLLVPALEGEPEITDDGDDDEGKVPNPYDVLGS